MSIQESREAIEDCDRSVTADMCEMMKHKQRQINLLNKVIDILVRQIEENKSIQD